MNVKKFAAGVAGLLMLTGVSGAFAGEELLITTNATKANAMRAFTLDITTDGNAAGIQFNIALPKGIAPSQVDLSRCMADLPKTHRGECSVAKGQIIGIAYNDDGLTLPAGVVSIGQIRFNGKVNARAESLKVLNYVVSTFEAKELPTTSMVR